MYVSNRWVPALIVTAVALLLGGCLQPVPDVVGLEQAVAEATIEEAGFAIGTITAEYSDAVALGLVISQDPAAGMSIEQGAPVALVVSLGPSVTPPGVLSLAAGIFPMGDAGGDDDEQPVHDVTVSAYEIGAYEVTNARYAAVMNWALDQGLIEGQTGTITFNGQELVDLDSPYCQISYSDGAFSATGRGDHPIVLVSWYGAVAYCTWLSEALGLTPCYDLSIWALTDPAAGGYRLPTEAEWERAAAWDGTCHWRYGIGSDSLTTGQANCENVNPLGLSGWPYTSPAGHYDGQTSPAGCYDMSGNVAEWVHDLYGYTYYDGCRGGVTDPLGPASGPGRVVRGGGWDAGVGSCRSAIRSCYAPLVMHYAIGFRVARAVVGSN